MFPTLSTPFLVLAFVLAGAVIVAVSLKMTDLADRIADGTGLGEAVIGATALGAATSLSGLTVSVTAAANGDASLAFSNAVGGIAAQTVFLALADLSYRKANIEHAVAEPSILFQTAMLLILLTLPIVAYAGPDFTLAGIHPVSYVMAGAYVFGTVAAARVRRDPMWRAVRTSATREDCDDPAEAENLPRAIAAFLALVPLLAAGGWVISSTSEVAILRFGLSSSAVGALFTAVVTSLPELITTLAAVRRGALQLAVGGIIGGNMFDTIFLTASDAAYRDGSLFHAIGRPDLFWLTAGLLMTTTLMLGLIARQKDGPARIGVESLALIAIYATAVTAAAVTLTRG
ncbi:MAG: sodium:calcium antiporter [Shimia sp.]